MLKSVCTSQQLIAINLPSFIFTFALDHELGCFWRRVEGKSYGIIRWTEVAGGSIAHFVFAKIQTCASLHS